MVTTRSRAQKQESEPLITPISSPAERKKKSRAGRDTNSILLLVVLYMLQGIPLGLAMGSLPFILQGKLTYSELGLLSLSSYPYSLKLFWSPIVDSIYSKAFGRRKSWIIPLQILLGSLMLFIGSRIDYILAQKNVPATFITLIFTLMVFLCATQDIAVDGWAISLLTEENKTYASTAQTIGLNTGFFLSFTVFLAFNSADFCNSYIRSIPSDVGLLTLGSYLTFWGGMYILVTVCLLLFKTHDPEEEEESIWSVYVTIGEIARLPHMQRFIIISMICKIGWQAHEAVYGFKLMEMGFKKEHLAMTALLDFPLQIVFGYYAAKWSSGPRPLNPWVAGYYGRLVSALLAMLLVLFYPKSGLNSFYFVTIMLGAVISNFAATIQFVSMGSFFSKISDPAIGGTYMTLLNTFSNFGGTWPKYFVMMLVEYFTDAPCSAIGSPQCMDEKSTKACLAAGGKCSYISDGYYLINSVCIAFGLLAMIFFIHPNMKVLESLPASAWRIKQIKKKK